MRYVTSLVVLIAMAATAQPAAWDIDIHRRITTRAIEGLRGPVRDVLYPERAFIEDHVGDPDMWRIVDLRSALGPEAPNHFLDIDVLDEAAPYTGVPREWDAFVMRYGRERADRAGRLPWRIEDMYTRLTDAFKAVRAGNSRYAVSDARFITAVLAHYVEDSFQPLHAVGNYDGQLTGQRGLHARFEGELARRHWSAMRHAPVAISPIPDIKAFAFQTIADSAALVPGLLDADQRAARGTTRYDDAYYTRFLAGAKTTLETRLDGAASAVASVITAAWNASAAR